MVQRLDWGGRAGGVVTDHPSTTPLTHPHIRSGDRDGGGGWGVVRRRGSSHFTQVTAAAVSVRTVHSPFGGSQERRL